MNKSKYNVALYEHSKILLSRYFLHIPLWIGSYILLFDVQVLAGGVKEKVPYTLGRGHIFKMFQKDMAFLINLVSNQNWKDDLLFSPLGHDLDLAPTSGLRWSILHWFCSISPRPTADPCSCLLTITPAFWLLLLPFDPCSCQIFMLD